jgi:hypothetical protein
MHGMIPDTDYPLAIKSKVAQYAEQYSDDEYLQRYQYIAQQDIIHSSKRGKLVFQSTGTGKSILMGSLIDYSIENDPERKIVTLLPKSLQRNLEINLAKYIRNKSGPIEKKSKEYIEKVIDSIHFISLNASNMFEQVTKVNKTIDELSFEKQLTNLNSYVGHNKNFLENSLVIMDEAHNFSNSVTNGSKNGVKLYETMLATKNIKMVFFTATPIVNSPFELTPFFNLLRGVMHVGCNKYKLFPENQQDFNDLFVNKNYTIKNKDKFQNRIYGFVSYYGNYFLGDKESKIDFPKELPIIVEKVPMSMPQYTQYQAMRDIELKEEKNRYKKTFDNQVFAIREDSEINSYRIRSRQVCNYLIPEYAFDLRKNNTTVKRIYKIEDNDLDNLAKYSPKFAKIINNIEKYPSKLGMIYSEFVTGEGLNLFARVLEVTKGYVYWQKDTGAEYIEEEENQVLSRRATYAKTYAIISGDVPTFHRQKIISTFNSEKNAHGGIISLLLVSKTGAEGISLKNVRHIHIMEPFWNHVRIEQVIARGVRYQSHLGLPLSERTVQPYIYISTFPPNIKKPEETTTDEHIYKMSLINKKLRTEFELAMLEVSIDCSENMKHVVDPEIKKKIKCRLCAPTHQELYSNNIYIDIDTENVCKPIEEGVADQLATEILVDGVKYYYTLSSDKTLQIYNYNSDLGGYAPMKKNNPIYGEIARQILFA